jgi:hypothetical protein
MQKIGNITNTATIAGEFTDGNVAGGVPPTILDAAWFNTVQRELVNMVQSAGITLDPTNDAQVLAAIQALFLQKANNLSEIKAAGAVAQAAALTNLGSSDGTLSGRLLNVRTFTSSGVYTATPGTTKVRVRVQGGGGAGGGTAITSAGQIAIGFGGGAGTYGETPLITSGFSGVTMIIGSGGSPVGGGTGGSGGATSFGSIISAPGGAGGGAGPANTATISIASDGSLSGVCTGSAIFSKQGTGSTGGGSYSNSAVATNIKGNAGGNSFLSPGAPGLNGSSTALSATGYGAGGGGVAVAANASAALPGGYGYQGVIIVEEYA